MHFHAPRLHTKSNLKVNASIYQPRASLCTLSHLPEKQNHSLYFCWLPRLPVCYADITTHNVKCTQTAVNFPTSQSFKFMSIKIIYFVDEIVIELVIGFICFSSEKFKFGCAQMRPRCIGYKAAWSYKSLFRVDLHR